MKQGASSSSLPAEAFRMPAPQRALILCSAPACRARTQHAHPSQHPSTPPLIAWRELQKKMLLQLTPTSGFRWQVFMLFKHILAHPTYNYISQTELYIRLRGYRITCPPPPPQYLEQTLLRTTAPFRNGILHGRFHWRLYVRHAHRHIYLPICMCLHQLSLKSRRIIAGLSNREPSPQHFSAQPSGIIKQSCQDPQPLLKNTTTCQGEYFSFVLNSYFVQFISFHSHQ